MKIKPTLETIFYRDGRGPELQKVVWADSGVTLVGFEYYNPDDIYEKENIKHIRLIGVEAFSFAGEEVHPDIYFIQNSDAAIFEVIDSDYKKSLSPRHLANCKHYQLIFYDEIFDIICSSVVSGVGPLSEEQIIQSGS